MSATARQVVKRGLTRLGAALPEHVLYDLNGVVNYLEAGAFMRRRGFIISRRVSFKRSIFELIAAEISQERVLYLEFGVAEGASMRHWSTLLRNAESHLHGFDSFEGLPSDWILSRPAGHFSTQGRVPEIEDQRVRFFKGWFDETLPSYTWPGYDVLVVNIDADLYASTVTALKAVEGRLAPGTFLYFDEFNHRGDEMRAFSELLDRSAMDFELFAASHDLAHVAFRLADPD